MNVAWLIFFISHHESTVLHATWGFDKSCSSGMSAVSVHFLDRHSCYINQLLEVFCCHSEETGLFKRSGNRWQKAPNSGLLVLSSCTHILLLFLFCHWILNKACRTVRQCVSILPGLWQDTDKYDSSWLSVWMETSWSDLSQMSLITWLDSFSVHAALDLTMLTLEDMT